MLVTDYHIKITAASTTLSLFWWTQKRSMIWR